MKRLTLDMDSRAATPIHRVGDWYYTCEDDMLDDMIEAFTLLEIRVKNIEDVDGVQTGERVVRSS